MKIIIGASTYGSLPRVHGFVRSFYGNLETTKHELITVVVDDGTPDMNAVREREQFCQQRGFRFLRNEKNLGISATWNRIASCEPDADLALIFNDDTRFLAPGWLTRLVHFFENNDDVGTVGLPLVSDMGFKDDEPRWRGVPGRVGAAVGCAFAVQPKKLFTIKNSDDSLGFWDDLISFHEEIHLGFRMAEKGWISYMLPWSPLYHQGGATFQASPELVWREPSSYLSMDEFLTYARSLPWYVADYEKQYAEGTVDRMMFSRGMFCKYWGILDRERMQNIPNYPELVDCWAEPQKFVHWKAVNPWPPRIVKYLDKDGKEQQCETQ